MSTDHSASTDNAGLLCMLGLSEEALTIWSKASIATNAKTILTNDTAECGAYAGGTTPTVVAASTNPRLDVRLLNPSEPALRRAATVVVAADRAEADYWRNLAWDAIPSDSSLSEVVTTIRAAMVEAQRRRELWDLVDDYKSRIAELSKEERLVLEAVCLGRLNKQIAKDTGVSIRTVEQRRRRVFEKMGVESAIPLASRMAVVRTVAPTTHRLDRAAPAVPKPNLFSLGLSGSPITTG